MTRFDRELEVAQDLARKAGALALRYFDTDLEVERKDENEPVTRADQEASELILRGLGEHFPDDVLISEEGADDRARLEPDRRVWFIDPIDGTNDFIHHREGWAVMLGLAIGGVPKVGVVYQPIGDAMYRASVGELAEVTDPEGTHTLRVSDNDDIGRTRLVASRSHRTGKIDEVKKALGVTDELNIGSVGLKLGLIARGIRDLYVNPASRCKTWDTCGPQAIIEAAGGRLTDLHGQPLTYTDADMFHTRGMLASNGKLHDPAVTRLRPLFPPPT